MKKIALFAAVWLSACTVLAGSAHPGETVELHGRLVLRGNEPFVYAVVDDDRVGIWTLEGISRPDAVKLQNHIVRVTATVMPEQTSGRTARVQSIVVDDPQ